MAREYAYKGSKHTLSIWAAKYGVNYNTLSKRLLHGVPFGEALSKTPLLRTKWKQLGKDIDKYIVRNTESILRDTELTETIEDDIIIPIEICSYFGCKKQLNMNEKLCGTRCCNHPIVKPKSYFNPLL